MWWFLLYPGLLFIGVVVPSLYDFSQGLGDTRILILTNNINA